MEDGTIKKLFAEPDMRDNPAGVGVQVSGADTMLARIAGTGEFSDEILAAGREAVLDRAAPAKRKARKSVAKKAAMPVRP